MASRPPSELMEFIEPEVTGTPSITYSGELEALKEPIPRILKEAEEPGWPEAEVNCTPVAFPCNKSWKETEGTSAIFSFFTLAAEPA